jgi:predicted acylesterase/phospholipase RssA
VRAWLEAVARDPAPLFELTRCLEASGRGERDAAACYRSFSAPDGVMARWGLPANAPPLATPPGEPEQVEIDAERFAANARALAASLVELLRNLADTRPDLAPGVSRGARRAADYVAKRRWSRGPRPATSLVLGGGSANGAFSAGFVFRLMEVLESCRRARSGGCPSARIDLVAGTSTGTLIGALTDLYFTPGRERAAMDLVLENYTCSVEADLYCVPDEYVWKLVQDAHGLVRFAGVADKIDRFITPEVESNALELVGVTVDLTSGSVIGLSDQDPADAMLGCGRRNALLASIVLPVMAEPVNAIEFRSGTRAGPFVDGGVGSIVPMLEAVDRGAERVVVLSNYPLTIEPGPSPRHAIDVLTRTMILGIVMPGSSEPERAALTAATRRLLEYRVCRERFESWDQAGSDTNASRAFEPFCRRRPDASGAPAPASLSAWRPSSLPEIESSFQSAWVYRPESSMETAQGYAFDPRVMRPLFSLGVSTFQRRCLEMLDLLAIDGPVARAACAEQDAPARVARRFRSLDQCPTREIPTCEAPIGCARSSARQKQ